MDQNCKDFFNSDELDRTIFSGCVVYDNDLLTNNLNKNAKNIQELFIGFVCYMRYTSMEILTLVLVNSFCLNIFHSLFILLNSV